MAIPTNGVLPENGGLTEVGVATKISVADLAALVKEYDGEYLPKEVDLALRNDDGTPKVFYHGTGQSFDAFSFDELSPREGSFFFAENKEDAKAYGNNVIEVYLTGENLADYDNQPSEFYRLRDKKAQVQWLKERGYDGWYSDMDSSGWGEVSVYSPGQIKSATSNIGTFNEQDDRYRYSKKDSPESKVDRLYSLSPAAKQHATEAEQRKADATPEPDRLTSLSPAVRQRAEEAQKRNSKIPSAELAEKRFVPEDKIPARDATVSLNTERCPWVEKNRDDHAVTAQPYTLGSVSQTSLDKNIARFKRFVNSLLPQPCNEKQGSPRHSTKQLRNCTVIQPRSHSAAQPFNCTTMQQKSKQFYIASLHNYITVNQQRGKHRVLSKERAVRHFIDVQKTSPIR